MELTCYIDSFPSLEQQQLRRPSLLGIESLLASCSRTLITPRTLQVFVGVLAKDMLHAGLNGHWHCPEVYRNQSKDAPPSRGTWPPSSASRQTPDTNPPPQRQSPRLFRLNMMPPADFKSMRAAGLSNSLASRPVLRSLPPQGCSPSPGCATSPDEDFSLSFPCPNSREEERSIAKPYQGHS